MQVSIPYVVYCLAYYASVLHTLFIAPAFDAGIGLAELSSVHYVHGEVP